MSIIEEILAERQRQTEKHGNQLHLPDGTGPARTFVFPRPASAYLLAEWAKARTDAALAEDALTYEHILTEEWAEALAEKEPEKLREELIQVAAVALQWLEAIDARSI